MEAFVVDVNVAIVANGESSLLKSRIESRASKSFQVEKLCPVSTRPTESMSLLLWRAEAILKF